jgi:hypothetical protein
VPGEGGELIDFVSVEARLVEAFDVLRRLPDPERRFLRTRTMGLWAEVRPERVDIDGEGQEARPGVTRGELRRMEEALGWCEWLDGPARKLVGATISSLREADQQPNWPHIRRILGETRTTDALRMAYGRALSRICGKLNAGSGRAFG